MNTQDNNPDPLSQSGVKNAYKLLKKLQHVQQGFFKLQNKSAKHFKQVGEEAIKQMQAILEEQLTKHFATHTSPAFSKSRGLSSNCSRPYPNQI